MPLAKVIKQKETLKKKSWDSIDKNGPIILADSPQAKRYPEIANTKCWIRGHTRRFYIQQVGPVPKRLEICHKCDCVHGPCCNLDHLFLGTHKDNIHDCLEKKRFRGWASNHKRNLEERARIAYKGWDTRRKLCQH